MDLSESLTPPQRLAIAYAPRAARGDWAAVLALDARLAAIVRGVREPMLAQIRLAWWRERLAEPPAAWPAGEPVLAALASWGDAAGLAGLVDGWEALLLAEAPLGVEAITAFAEGRAAAVAALAKRLGAADAGVAAMARRWALADLAAHLSDPGERAMVAAVPLPRRVRLGRVLRPLAVLERLAAGAVFAGMRVGILGI